MICYVIGEVFTQFTPWKRMYTIIVQCRIIKGNAVHGEAFFDRYFRMQTIFVLCINFIDAKCKNY